THRQAPRRRLTLGRARKARRSERLHPRLHRRLVARSVVVVMSVLVLAAVLVTALVPAMVSVPVLTAFAPLAGVVFRRSYEVHRSIAGVILVTVLAPVLRMARRNVQIDRLRLRYAHHHRCGLDHHRPSVDHRRGWPVTDHHLAIHTGNHLAGDDR